MNNQWREHAECMVVWADGTYDHGRTCDECSDPNCSMSVHTDHYSEVGQTRLENEDANSNGGYWEYMQSNQPLGGKFDFDGELMVKEFFTANPDGLCHHNQRPDKCDFCNLAVGEVTRTSGTKEQQYEWAKEAVQAMTPKQKQVWELVMRQQLSQTEVARRLGVTQPVVATHLSRAKEVFTTYMKGKQNA